MTVSIILTSYNKPEWLQESIDSVFMQTYRDFELILMDDNSPNPNIKPILDHYRPHDQVKVYESNVSEEDRYKTARYATLINIGVRTLSTGEYITYLTDDDYYYPYRLERMVEHIERLGVDVVYGAQHIIDATGRVAGYRVTQGILDNAWDKVDHNSVLHTRKVFDDVDGWDDNPGTWGGADSYFWRKVNEAGYLFYPLDDQIPNECKRYHTDSIQWKMSNNVFFETDMAKR